MEDDKDFKPVTDAETAAAVATALSESVDTPELDEPQDNFVTLLAGIKVGDTKVTSVQVRELTGEDEEVLARTAQTARNNVFHFVNVLLEAGIVRYGTEKPSQSGRFLKNTLVGDRDTILMGIRRATYGDEIELERWICPGCDKESDLTIPLEDIPIRELKKGTSFDVPLRKGGHAEVRLANGADQAAVFADDGLNRAERDTILLSRCIVAIVSKDGQKRQAAGHAATITRGLSVPDRHKILRELNNNQPGPRLDELKITHDTCGKEVELFVGIAELFPDLILG